MNGICSEPNELTSAWNRSTGRCRYKRKKGIAHILKTHVPLHVTRRAVLTCGLSALGSGVLAQDFQRSIVLATVSPSPGTLTGTWLEMVYREAFRRLGFRVSFVFVPGKRAESMSTTGAVDGEIHRAMDYGKTRPTLCLVPTSHFPDAFAAYATRPIVLKDGWDSLRNTDLKVNYQLGGFKAPQELTGRVPAAQLHTVDSVQSGLRKLVSGRSDIFIHIESSVDSFIRRPEFKDAQVRKVAVMEKLDGYTFLNIKNEALAKPLADALAEMHRDGSIERLRKQAVLEEGLGVEQEPLTLRRT